METVPLRVGKIFRKDGTECKECEQAEQNRRNLGENRRSFILRCMLGNNTNCQKINAEKIVAKAKILERYLEVGK